MYEAELAMRRRIGASDPESERNILVLQGNLGFSYAVLGRLDDALSVRHDVYSARLKLDGEEQIETILAANNYAVSLVSLERFEEAKALYRKTMPVARRVLGESHEITIKIGWIYGQALYRDPNATLANLRKAVTTLEDVDRIARRVLGGAHPFTADVGLALREARAVLGARETPPPRSA